ITSHGLQGYTGIAVAEGKNVRVAVLYLREQAFIFIATTKAAGDFSKFDASFRETVMSFHALRDDEKHLAKAQRIEVVKVGNNDSYANWAATTRISNSPIQQLRLLNGHYPNGELKPGQMAKRIR
ncbi:MAG: peptidase, partial [Methylophaga nitratireducenticrescens]